MYAGRIPALQKSNVNINPNMTKEQMNAGIPRNIQWKGPFAKKNPHYFPFFLKTLSRQLQSPSRAGKSLVARQTERRLTTYLKPTQFYAIALALIYLEANDPLTVNLAWGYLGIRVVHSLVQALANPIMPRFYIFATSSMVLAGLTAKAAMLVF